MKRGKKTEKALEYYKLAASHGDMDATYCMAGYFENGIGVVQDWEQALTYYMSAASEGHPGALFRLGLCFERGELDLVENEKQALEYFQKVEAKHGHAIALYKMGLLFRDGIFVNQNLDRAFKFFDEARDKGCMEAQSCIDSLLK